MSAKRSKLTQSPDEKFRRDTLVANNPVLVQGLALAPVIAAALTLKNALMLAAAGSMLMIPTRFFANLLAGSAPHRLRPMIYSITSALIYIPIAALILRYFALDAVAVGMYLPLLVVDSIVLSRSGMPEREKVFESLFNGVRTALGFSLVIAFVGALRELLAYNKLMGVPVVIGFRLALFGTTAGGFVIVAVLCALLQWIISAMKRLIYSEVKKNDQ